MKLGKKVKFMKLGKSLRTFSKYSKMISDQAQQKAVEQSKVEAET